MKKLFALVFLFSILVSCTKAKTKTEEANDTLSVKKEVSSIETKSVETVADEEFKNDFAILLASTFRDWEGENPAKSLTKNWIDLYEKNGKYYLGKADFDLESGFSECSGDSTKTIESRNKTVLFMDYPELKLGEVKSLKISQKRIWPKEKIAFTFNNVEYFLRGEGDIIEKGETMEDGSENPVPWHKVENYKLFISTKDTPEKLLLKEDSFNDTFVELIFVGDIDRDGKLDFIFSANRHYEEERVILFLSSKAKENLVKKVSEIVRTFDC
ncbi:hypothetical protein MH928_17470 [Flavobacterium sp. WW92]|uniref:hypothetical protein n=1 Tax=unclassified Flavobacterium TaxID=196869 RepID=UPI0022245E6A|nr:MULTISPECIES: hypothetical protein [unclassified Flavobacterium]WDO13099.1 hypothetical protein MH928_17470 [Flavobacterium sp. WW92]